MKLFGLLRKVQFLFAAVLLGFGLVTSLSVWLLAKNAVKNQVEEDVQVATSYLRQFLVQRRGRLDLQTRMIADQPAIRAICSDPEKSQLTGALQEKLGTYLATTGTDGLVLFDKEGNPLQILGKHPNQVKSLDLDNLMLLSPIAQGLSRGLEPFQDGLLLTSVAPVKEGAQVVGL